MHIPLSDASLSSGSVDLLEDIVVVAGLILAWPLSRYMGDRFEAAERAFRGLAGKRVIAILIAGLLPVILRCSLLPFIPIPAPAIHEEFSNLLEADTFASGRLTNPAHPMAPYFETFQVIQHPSYCSIRPPAYAAFLAVGETLGSPWFGVVLSVALMCMAMCWMLQEWTTPAWALLAAILLGLRLGVLGYWMNSYWGGSVTALAGTLILGALPGLKRFSVVKGALPMAAGLILIAITRPYEGAFFLLAVAIWLVLTLWRGNIVLRRAFWKNCFAPVLLLTAGFMSWAGYFDARTTGHPTESPYVYYRLHYSSAPSLIWEEPARRHFSIPEMQTYFIRWELPYYQRIVSRSTYASELGNKVAAFYRFYIRPAFLIPLLLIPLVYRKRYPGVRLCGLILIAECLAAELEVWGAPYYFACLTPVIYLLVVQTMREMRGIRWGGRPVGAFLVRWLAACVIGIFAFSAGLEIARIRIRDTGAFFLLPGPNLMEERARIEKTLESLPGKQLVIVHYAQDHNPHQEWVWNRSDIDDSKVVWARDLGPGGQQPLLSYFHDRTVWAVDPDRNPPLLTRVSRWNQSVTGISGISERR